MSPVDATLPFQLQDPRFEAAWEEYVQYRKERKLGKLLSRSVQKQWDRMAAVGMEVAIEAIDQTIASGWQGIFLDRVAQRGESKTQFASLGALQMQLDTVRGEIADILRPGGSAFNKTEFTSEQNTRLNNLYRARDGLLQKIERFSQAG